MSDLRDHSQPCQHDTDWYWEGQQDAKSYRCARPDCPGGQVVTINYEAAEEMNARSSRMTWGAAAHLIVDAALALDTPSVLLDVDKISEGDETLSSVPSPSTPLPDDNRSE